VFDDLLAANAAYRETFDLGGLVAGARRGLAIITCIDSRIEPLSMLGLVPGDAKIIRNAGARVTDDVLRSLVLATHLLGVTRVGLVHHTDCRMASATEEELHRFIGEATGGADTAAWDFLAIEDRDQVVRDDLERLRSCPLLPDDLEIASFLYDVGSGRLEMITPE
jgi:carbonic anhydrase